MHLPGIRAPSRSLWSRRSLGRWSAEPSPALPGRSGRSAVRNAHTPPTSSRYHLAKGQEWGSMTESNDSSDAATPPEPEWVEPSPEKAEELLKNPGKLAGMIRDHPEMLQNLASGYRAMREGFSEFLTANDRGADRVKDTADKVIGSIQSELDRDGLSPNERYRLIEAEERILGQVRGNEKEVREANERSFAKIAAITTSVAVGAVVLGYLVKEGKLPPLNPPTI